MKNATKTTTKRERIKMSFDDNAYAREYGILTHLLPSFSDLAAICKEADLNTADVNLPDLINNPEGTLLVRMPESFRQMAEHLHISALNFGKYTPIIAQAKQIAKSEYALSYLDFFTISDGEASILPHKLDQLKERYAAFCETTEQHERLELATRLADAINAYNDRATDLGYRGITWSNIQDVIHHSINFQNGQASVKPAFVTHKTN